MKQLALEEWKVSEGVRFLAPLRVAATITLFSLQQFSKMAGPGHPIGSAVTCPVSASSRATSLFLLFLKCVAQEEEEKKNQSTTAHVTYSEGMVEADDDWSIAPALYSDCRRSSRHVVLDEGPILTSPHTNRAVPQ